MAGHSHWANIAHKKAIKDAKKGKILSKLAKLIYSAVKEGKSGKPEENPRLRLVLDKCRLANMTKDAVQRNIEKAVGGGQGYEPMTIEGYGPGGIAFVVEAMTDNPGRTGPEIRNLIERNGGKMGKPGATMHLFARRGVFEVEKDRAPEEKLLEIVLEAGAEDVVDQDTFWQILTPPTAFLGVGEALQKGGVVAQQSEMRLIAENPVEVDAEAAGKMMRFLELVEDHDDVQNAYTNFDVSAETAAQLGTD